MSSHQSFSRPTFGSTDAGRTMLPLTVYAQSPAAECPKEAPRHLSILLQGRLLLHSPDFGIRHRSLFAEHSHHGSGGTVSTTNWEESSCCRWRAIHTSAVSTVVTPQKDSREIPSLHPATARARRRQTERQLRSPDENDQRRNRGLVNRLIEPCDLTRVQSPKHVREEQPDPADQHSYCERWRRIVVVARILSETPQLQ